MNKRNKNTMIAIAVAMAVIAWVIFMSVSNLSANNRALSLAEAVCEHSHDITSGKWENACGELQEATNTKFLCDGIEAEANCWMQDLNNK